MRRRAFWLLLAAAPSALLPSTSAAQAVHGHLLDRARGVPLVGAYVTLEVGGGTVSAAVSGPDGRFSLIAPGAGEYVVRGDHVGYAPAVAEVRVDAADVEVALASEPLVIPLEGLSTDVDRSCRIDAEAARRVAALWDEVGAALRVAALVQEQALLGFELETWYRQLEPRRLRVVEEDRTPRPGFQPTAQFPSPPAAELARAGYVRGGGPGESMAFYGPDARTLTSEAFRGTHCLGFDDDGPEEGWVGLTFLPLDGDARDVEGTLWIDSGTYEPRALEYRFTELPWPVKTDKVGGRTEFRRLAGGALIARRWWKRMPRVGVRQERITPWAEPQARYTLTGVVEEGGEVVRVRTPDGRIEDMR